MKIRRTLSAALPVTLAALAAACGGEGSTERAEETSTGGASAPQTSNESVTAGGEGGTADVTSGTSPLQPGHRFVGDVDGGLGDVTLLVSRPGDSVTATFELAATHFCAARTVELGPFTIEDGVASTATSTSGATTVTIDGMHLAGELTLPATAGGCDPVDTRWTARNQGSTVG